jgi:hypothetical protein
MNQDSRRFGLLCVVWALQVTPSLAGQARPAAPDDSARVRALVAQARALIPAHQLDSAVAVLRAAAANPAADTGTVGAEVGLLLAIAHHLRGDQRGVAEAVSGMLDAMPELEAGNLATVPEAITQTLDAQRRCRASLGAGVDRASCVMAAADSGTPGARGSAASADSVVECVRRCQGGERKPVLLSLPNLWELYGSVAYPMERWETRHFILLRFVVEKAGTVRLGSVEVLSSTAPRMVEYVRRALLEARFRPAMAGTEPVSARVQLRVEFYKVGGEGRVTYDVSGP